MKRRAYAFLLACLLAFSVTAGSALAVRPDEMLKDPQLEQRAREISRSLRCLVCQNQSIDDSDADLAHDLRVLVRQRLMAGDSDDQVRQYIVNRYGNYVLLDPPFNEATLILWAGPAILLLMSSIFAASFFRQREPEPEDTEDNEEEPPLLSDSEHDRLKNILDEERGKTEL